MLLTLDINFFLIKCNILRFEEMQTVTQQFFIFKFCVYIFDKFNAEGKSLKDNQLAMAIHCDLL